MFSPQIIVDHKSLLNDLDLVISDQDETKILVSHLRQMFNEPSKLTDVEVIERHRIRLRNQIN